MRLTKMVQLGLAVLISSVSLFAQPDSLNYKSQIQFHLVNVYSLSYVNFLTQASSLRYKLDLNLSVSTQNGDGNSTNFPDNYHTSNSHEDAYNSQSVSFSGQYLFYPVRNSIVKMFIGSGPYLGLSRMYSKQNHQNTQNDGSSSTNIYETLNYSLALGLEGIFGVECYITNQISIIGEYSAYASYSWGKDEYTAKYTYGNSPYTNENKSENNSHGWNVGIHSLRLGVAFRF